ncbi:hypothetical protein TIFTF001_016557 [Ficus carica]|uniref:Uncharacterized protein n=1 Tax=Ficus carica TaxID=3494 RepID=A0AA88ATF5_FICCA|nr:hypothetical protein TIFTF001_016557 [Ficus carica]
MKNSSVMLVLAICLAACAQEAHSRSYTRSWPLISGSAPALGGSGSAPAPGGSDIPPQIPKWLQPPTADEIENCRVAREFSKWKACRDERFQRSKNGTFTPGPVCCTYIAGVVSGCFSHFPHEFQDRIYPKVFCSRYH